MPRPAPLKPTNIPQVERKQRLSQLHDFAGLLGFATLPDDVADELAHTFALMRVSLPLVAGLTRKRCAAELKRCAKGLRREQRTGRLNVALRERLADPRLGFDTDTFLRLEPLTAAPTSELLAAVETHRLELTRLPQVSPQRQARESAGGVALWFFMVFAADGVRDEPGAWWRFVLAALDATGFPTVKLYEHPESLRPLLDKLRADAGPFSDAARAEPSLLFFRGRSQH
jgi:hypothetical protein